MEGSQDQDLSAENQRVVEPVGRTQPNNGIGRVQTWSEAFVV